MIEITIHGYPDRDAGPNGRAHHFAKARIVKRQRGDAKLEARSQQPALEGAITDCTYTLHVGMPSKRHKPQDQENFLAVCKSLLDGVTDWLSDGEDSGWRCTGITWDYANDGRGFVTYRIEEQP